MLRRLVPALIPAVIALGAPAGASAATFTVDPSAAPGCNGATCKTITDAVGAASAGDVIGVLPGTYAESVSIGAGRDGLRILGQPAAGKPVLITPSGGSPGFDVTASNVLLDSMTISVSGSGGPAVRVEGGAAGTVLRSLLMGRTSAGANANPVLDVTTSASGAPTTLLGSSVAQNGDAPAPAVFSSSPGGIQVADSAVAGGSQAGMTITASTANVILRSQVFGLGTAANGVEVISHNTSSSPKGLTVESSIISGGTGAAAVRLYTEPDPALGGSRAGDITFTATHLTTAGIPASNGKTAMRALDVEALANGVIAPVGTGPVGNITATVHNSIVHGLSKAVHFAGTGLLTDAPNAATLTLDNVDSPGAVGTQAGDPSNTAGGTITRTGSTLDTTEAQEFGDPAHLNLHLKAAGAAAVDQGNDTPSGTATDVDGEPRKIGPATDLGADELINLPPVVSAITVDPVKPVPDGPANFTATATDPDASYLSKGVTSVVWSFGDNTQATTSGAAASHVYKQEGTYKVTAHAVDGLGAVGQESDPLTVTVVRGPAPPGSSDPEVTISAPRHNSSVRLTRRVRRHHRLVLRRIPLDIRGRASDPQGVRSVQVALIRLGRTRRIPSPTATCLFFTGSRFASQRCIRVRWLEANLADFDWGVRIKVPLAPGYYLVLVRATDLDGNTTTRLTVANHAAARFKVR